VSDLWETTITFEAADREEAERLTEAALTAVCEGDEADGSHSCRRWAGASLQPVEGTSE
jgi:hypothetical protein